MKDIIKGVIYDRGSHTLNGETKHLTLVALVIASDKPLTTKDNPEYIVMGECDVSDELMDLVKYECPYKFGNISHAIVEVSNMVPDELDELNGEGYE